MNQTNPLTPQFPELKASDFADTHNDLLDLTREAYDLRVERDNLRCRVTHQRR